MFLAKCLLGFAAFNPLPDKGKHLLLPVLSFLLFHATSFGPKIIQAYPDSQYASDRRVTLQPDG